jgi:glucosamine kinase
MMTKGVILGIDGGGSKTLIALADSTGQVLGVVRGEPINPLDSRGWRSDLEAQVRPFAAEAGLRSVAAALPAYGEVEEISSAQRETIAAVFGTIPQCVLNDVDAAHIGAFAGGPGILVLSGTGSMAWARDAAGRSYRVGGWGDMIGDEGSSYWIGRRVLGAVSQSLDGRGEQTALVAAVLEHLQVDPANPVNGIEGWVSRLRNPRSQIGALAPLATRLAGAGDAIAQTIVADAAAELERHITSIARLAGLPTEWSYAGGTFGSEVLRDMVAARIGRQPHKPRLPPICGALLAATRCLDWQIDAAWIERLATTMQDELAKIPQPQPTN